MYQRKINITRIRKKQKIEENDVILIESPIDIIVNSESLVNIICLPKDLKELSIGFLFSIGIINSVKEIKSIVVNELEKKILVELDNSIDFSVKNLEINPVSRVVDTTCGISSPWRNIIKNSLEKYEIKESLKEKLAFKIKSDIIYAAIKEMHIKTNLYRETGGCHGAAIFNLEGNLISVKEDIGRHNAIDKVIGDLLLKEHDFKDIFLVSTGRLTGDSVLKAIRAQIPIIASLSAAIESGVRLAFAYGITLIGFVRGSRMNIYTHPYRIVI
ncbi:MAG: formate dehydrogenase accessory sulfurtransferase FdhD [Promethearchaeota archaeon]